MDRCCLPVFGVSFSDVKRETMPVAVCDDSTCADHGVVIDCDKSVTDDGHSTHANMVTDSYLCCWCLCAESGALHRADIVAPERTPDATVLTNYNVGMWRSEKIGNTLATEILTNLYSLYKANESGKEGRTTLVERLDESV